MKIRSQPPLRRRRNPLMLPLILLAALVVAMLAWAWTAGGPQPQKQVEKNVAPERLGK